MELTTENYHSPENNNLTTSKVKDYLLDEKYFFDKHVLHTITDEKSDALIIGSMVDTAIDAGIETMSKLYVPVARRSKDNGSGVITEVTEAMWSEANGLIEAIMATTAYKELSGFKRQVILEMPLPVVSKHFGKNFCGMLDFLSVDTKNNTATIVDLKTSRTVDERKYYWHALDLGYFLQAAAYVMLVSHKYGIAYKDIRFLHLVVEKDPKAIYKVKTFEFTNESIVGYIEVLKDLIYEIITKDKFEKADCSLESAIKLVDPKQVAAEAEHMTEGDWEKV